MRCLFTSLTVGLFFPSSILWLSWDPAHIQSVKALLQWQFEIKDLSPLRHFPKIEVAYGSCRYLLSLHKQPLIWYHPLPVRWCYSWHSYADSLGRRQIWMNIWLNQLDIMSWLLLLSTLLSQDWILLMLFILLLTLSRLPCLFIMLQFF